jgi:hypothetical protein
MLLKLRMEHGIAIKLAMGLEVCFCYVLWTVSDWGPEETHKNCNQENLSQPDMNQALLE